MLATFVSVIMILVLGAGVHMVPEIETMMAAPKGFFELFFGVSLFLSLLPWMGMLFLSQGAEVHPITIAALRSNIADRKLCAYSASIVAVSILGMFVLLQSMFPEVWSFAGAVLCIGILLDLVRLAYCRLQFRRTPEGLAEWFIEVMMESVKRGDEKWHTICFEIPFSLMVMYMKAGAYGSLRLFCHGIVKISDLWLGSIAHLRWLRVPGEFEVSLLDRYSQAERMTAKRIAWILQEACNLGSIAAVEEATRLAGKLFVTFHTYHESLGSVLLSTLSHASQRDCGRIGARDLDMEVVWAFSDVVKSLVERCIDRNMSDTVPILKVLGVLENKVKEIFHREKNISPAFLMQPLTELGHMLAHDRYRSLSCRDEVLADLRRLAAQIPSLVGVPVRLAENGDEVTDTKASFGDERPFSSHRKNM